MCVSTGILIIYEKNLYTVASLRLHLITFINIQDYTVDPASTRQVRESDSKIIRQFSVQIFGNF